MKVLEAIFGECWNCESGLRILIWLLEVPFFVVQKWSLLPKVPIFDTLPIGKRLLLFFFILIRKPSLVIAISSRCDMWHQKFIMTATLDTSDPLLLLPRSHPLATNPLVHGANKEAGEGKWNKLFCIISWTSKMCTLHIGMPQNSNYAFFNIIQKTFDWLSYVF